MSAAPERTRPSDVGGSVAPVRCGWCGTWRSAADRELGERRQSSVSHGICAECAEQVLAAGGLSEPLA